MPPRKACDICYKRKIQCLIPTLNEPCDWCSTHDLRCTFNRGTQRSKKTRASSGDVQTLLGRIEQLERALSSQNATAVEAGQSSASQYITPPNLNEQSIGTESPVSRQAPPQSHVPPNTITVGPLLASANVLGHNWYYRGMPILSEKGRAWITRRTGEENSVGKLSLFGSKLGPSLLGSQNLHLELPDEKATQKTLECFLSSRSWLRYPVVDRVLFENTIWRAYHDTSEPPSPQRKSAIVCVLALHTIACRPRTVRETLGSIDGEKCANMAQSALASITGDTNMESLQAVLMLQEYRRGSGQWQNANLLHSVACRMICDLGGQTNLPIKPTDQDPSESERKDWHMRRIFWLCYTTDKTMALRSGQPPLLTEDYCDLTLPQDDNRYFDYLPQLGQEDETQIIRRRDFGPLLPGNDVRLSFIKEKTCRLLYSPKATKMNDSQLLLNIRQLDDELEQWRMSVPSEFRPRLSIPRDRALVSLDETSPLARCFIINLQFEYHCTLTSIHAAVRRCGSEYHDDESIPDDLHAVLHSSIDLLLEAGRSTLVLLKTSIHYLKEEAFWDIAFYSPVAIMSLFVDVLIHPTSHHAQDDINVLMTAMSTIHSVPVDLLSVEEAESIQNLSDFIMDTVRLGTRAVWKARREKRDDHEDICQ